MELFENLMNKDLNLLPHDGTVHFFGQIFNQDECSFYLEYLLNEIPWKSDEAVIFGKVIQTKRKVAWFGEREFEYTYSGITKRAELFDETLLELKERCEKSTEQNYNSCLLNLYHDGSEGMAYHSDGEKDLKKNGSIASLSFGAERKFVFKHKITGEKVEIFLPSGSLLEMTGTTQKNWLHRLPPTKKIIEPRVNLTFRTIVN